MTKDTYQETGYIDTDRRNPKRVAFEDYGKTAKAEKAKNEIKSILEDLKIINEQLKRGK